MTEDEMVGWHHQLDGHGFGWTLGVGDGQGAISTWRDARGIWREVCLRRTLMKGVVKNSSCDLNLVKERFKDYFSFPGC